MSDWPLLNLPPVDFRFSIKDGEEFVWDEFRKRNILLTPEEWVRQNFLKYLVNDLQYPKSLIKVESGLKYNNLNKRHDALVYSNNGLPWLLVECKATDVKLNQSAFEQIGLYNKTIQAPYMVLTNGLTHFCCKQDFNKSSTEFLKEIPVWPF
ncbi:MAG: type I restriction enzyme HsdR N-terminal domain-containing protein [Reichenbachiella sp.]